MKIFKSITASVLILSMTAQVPVYAQEYLASTQDPSAAAQAPSGYGGVVPVGYNTVYNNQYPPTASFMQSPYGQLPVVGSVGPAVNYGAQAPAGGADPFGASEVSPYARYSPYTEIIGEGSTYTLGVDDIVTVIVRNQPDFSGRFVINPEGNIEYTFAGDIPAVGKTKDELKQEIVERLKKYVRYPEVAVMVSEYRSKHVFVFGYVNRPGKYAMTGDRITVKEAMVAAGLGRPDAALSRVYVVRPSENTESGKSEKKKVDVNDLLNKGNSAEDFFLEPGDTIVVSQRHFDKFVNNFSRLVGPLFQAAAVYNLAYGQNSGFLNDDGND